MHTLQFSGMVQYYHDLWKKGVKDLELGEIGKTNAQGMEIQETETVYLVKWT